MVFVIIAIADNDLTKSKNSYEPKLADLHYRNNQQPSVKAVLNPAKKLGIL